MCQKFPSGFNEREAHFPFPQAVRPDIYDAAFLLLLGDSVDEENSLSGRDERAKLDPRAECIHVQRFCRVAKGPVIRGATINANRNAETEPLAATFGVAAMGHQIDRLA